MLLERKNRKLLPLKIITIDDTINKYTIEKNVLLRENSTIFIQVLIMESVILLGWFLDHLPFNNPY